MSLNIVTVTCKLKCQDSIPEGDLLALDSLLLSLSQDDTGDQTPNPTNHFQLQKLGMKDFQTYIGEIGRPYRWAQLLAGLEYASYEENSVANLKTFVKGDTKVSANYMGSTINAIRDRVNSRLALQQQVTSLARGMIPTSPVSSKFPAKITARLVNWKSIAWEEFLTEKRRTKLVENGLLSPGHILFSAQIEKGSAKLKAQVNISPDYPSTTPLFHLSITWKHERDAHDAALRVMEREINVFCAPSDNLEANYLLTSQVQQLLMCFEVYLETSTGDSAFEGPAEFPKEKTFIRGNSGRDRSKPYKYIPNYGFFVHR